MKLKLALLSPERILELSKGEVKNPETLNFRFDPPRPEPDGILCEKIFGPVNNYECKCRSLIGRRHRGTVCMKCHVEVGPITMRMKRMGHIDLPIYVIHPLAKKAIGKLFSVGKDVVEELSNCYKLLKFVEDKEKGDFILFDKRKGNITIVGGLNTGTIFRDTYNESSDEKIKSHHTTISDQVGDEIDEEALSLAEMLQLINYEASSKVNLKVKLLLDDGATPNYFSLKYLLVPPAGYRPVIEMNGFWVVHNLNDHFSRIMRRKIRIESLLMFPTPKVILLYEQALLQRSVNDLMINGFINQNGDPIHSILDSLRGKAGIFRTNLLGKRVDYSGRSVITVGPDLKTNEAGIPIKMAYELFKPFVINKILERGDFNYKEARTIYEEHKLLAYDCLEEVVKNHRIMLNRQPTLHRYGIQSFKIVLHSGKSIQLPPLVCHGFNGDFDGDCLHGDVKVRLLNGISLTIPEMMDKYGLRSKVWVYSYDHENKRIVPAEAIILGRSGIKNKWVKITLDNDQVVTCSPEHPWMLRDGSYKKAKELSINDSMMPLYVQKSGQGWYGKDGREEIYQPELKKWEYTQDVASLIFNKPKTKSDIIHHIDFDYNNNNPENLKVMSRSEHNKYHSFIRSHEVNGSNGKDLNSKLENLPIDREYWLDKLGTSFPRDYWVNNFHGNYSITQDSFIKFLLNNVKLTYVDMYWSRRQKRFEQASSKLSKLGDRDYWINEILEISKVESNISNKIERLHHVKYKGVCTRGELIYHLREVLNIRNMRKLNKVVNHKIKDIQYLEFEEMSYDLEVPKYHNFATEAGVFTHNTMSCHIPLSDKALKECKTLMDPAKNFLASFDSTPQLVHNHEMIIGLYYMTKHTQVDSLKKLCSFEEGEYLLQAGYIRINTEVIFQKKSTCLGRMILSNIFKKEVNNVINKSTIKAYLSDYYDNNRAIEVLPMLDEVKTLAFKYATEFGLSLCMGDIRAPKTRDEVYKRIESDTYNEQEGKIRAWYQGFRDLEQDMVKELGENNPLIIMLKTGARAQMIQVSQLTVAKGLQANSAGGIVPLPIKHSLGDGLSTLEYFTTIHGARKSMADKKSLTPKSGYMTRRLVTACKDIYTTEYDCESKNGIVVKMKDAIGKFTVDGIQIMKDSITDENKNNLIKVRSVITCQSTSEGVCRKCYGINPSTRDLIDSGIPIGTIAAQALCEPTTQMSLRSFHTSGVAEIKSSPLTIDAGISGKVSVEEPNYVKGVQFQTIKVSNPIKEYSYKINPIVARILIKDGDEVEEGTPLVLYSQTIGNEGINSTIKKLDQYYEFSGYPTGLISTEDGEVKLDCTDKGIKITVNGKLQGVASTVLPVYVANGEIIESGRHLVHGEINIRDLFKKKGIEFAGSVFIDEIKKLYELEGMNPKIAHIETVFRALTELVITDKNEIGLRRVTEKENIKDILINGSISVSKQYPSWLKNVGFGWVKDHLDKVAAKPSISLDLPSERIMTGELITKRSKHAGY